MYYNKSDLLPQPIVELVECGCGGVEELLQTVTPLAVQLQQVVAGVEDSMVLVVIIQNTVTLLLQVRRERRLAVFPIWRPPFERVFITRQSFVYSGIRLTVIPEKERKKQTRGVVKWKEKSKTKYKT